MLPKKCGGVQLLTTQTPHKWPRVVERKVCFISGASNRRGRGEGGGHLSRGPFTPDKRGMRAFMDRMGGRGGCMQKQQSSLVVIYTWPSGV